jgi:hypothetical protein
MSFAARHVTVSILSANGSVAHSIADRSTASILVMWNCVFW